MQFSGIGFSDAMSISGLLGLDGSLYLDMWKAIEDHVGIIQQECALLATERCYAEELNQSSVDSDGSKILVCSFDMGWHKWSTGHIYNSLSGQAFLIGANTRKVIRMLVKAKKCGICEAARSKNVTPMEHQCVKNHEGSSKSMEASAACELLTDVYESGRTPVKIIVGGDDSTFRANIKHRIQDQLDAEEIAQWPRTMTKKGGSRKVVCTGKLPYSTPEVERELADPTHQQKTFAKPLFELAIASKKINQYSWSKADAERMKANYGYYVKLHRPGGPMELPVDEFVTNAQCVVEHSFNNHKLCSKWCLLSPASLKKEETTEEKQIELHHKYQTLQRNRGCTHK